MGKTFFIDHFGHTLVSQDSAVFAINLFFCPISFDFRDAQWQLVFL